MDMVDVQFSLTGNVIPVDHGYALFSAVSKIVSGLHGAKDFGSLHIRGTLVGDRMQLLTPQSSLTIRLPAEQVKEVIPLAGKVLVLGHYRIRVGVCRCKALVPSPSLYSRLVVIKGFMEPAPFFGAVQRQLKDLGIRGVPSLILRPDTADSNGGRAERRRSPFVRRTLRIHDKEVVGFALRVEGMEPKESVILQEKGIGGRRRFGCGIFVPFGQR